MEYNPFCKGDIPYFNLLADISYGHKIQIPEILFKTDLETVERIKVGGGGYDIVWKSILFCFLTMNFFSVFSVI